MAINRRSPLKAGTLLARSAQNAATLQRESVAGDQEQQHQVGQAEPGQGFGRHGDGTSP
jgi:hypothetical protein